MDSDYMRGKLLDYYVDLCTEGQITELEMESEMDDIAIMSSGEIHKAYQSLVVPSRNKGENL